MKKILLIIATHGNEKIGLEVVEKLKKFEEYFDILVANPKASEKNRRFIDVDLNRSYPGNYYSKNYEEKMACKNLKIAKKYQYIIDIHEASSGTQDFIIIPRSFFGNSFPVEWVDLDKILLWPFPQGPISQLLENSIELEFGMKNISRELVIKRAVEIVEIFIKNFQSGKSFDNFKKEWYYVYGKEDVENIEDIKKYSDFKKTSLNENSFYPLLVGQYLKEGIAFYKMKKKKI